jgi:pimeloyl-ACP methyl ester carboxylesterase
VSLTSRASTDVLRVVPPDPSTVRLPGPWTHRDVSANGIRLHIAETGSGPLVLLLHGFPEFWWAWHAQLTALGSAGYRAVAVDLRGYGDSDKPPRGYDGWTLAGDVAGLIKALGHTRAHLVGHAWGGMLAWTVAALQPRLVRSVSAVAAPHPLALRRAARRELFRRSDSQAVAIAQVFRAQLPIMPERRLVADDAVAVERLLRDWGGPQWTTSADFAEVASADRSAMRVPGVAHSSLEYFRWALRSQVRGDGRHFAEELDRRLTMPSLQVHGAMDPYLLESTAQASREWLAPRPAYHSLAGVGHFPHHEAPDTVNDLLIDFLDGLPVG